MKPLIVGNWKCNPATLAEAKQIFDSIKRDAENINSATTVICPPFVFLSYLAAGQKIKLGAQDAFWEDLGAYTGEISSLMLKKMRIQYVIIGHSERRESIKETDQMINKKMISALKHGLKPILCIDKIPQIKKGLRGISKKDLKNVILAYEPLFAIGTGKPCTIEKARKMRFSMKKVLGGKVPILYGGSVNSSNAKGYISQAGFQGLLVGGASLKPKEFIGIIKEAGRA